MQTLAKEIFFCNRFYTAANGDKHKKQVRVPNLSLGHSRMVDNAQKAPVHSQSGVTHR